MREATLAHLSLLAAGVTSAVILAVAALRGGADFRRASELHHARARTPHSGVWRLSRLLQLHCARPGADRSLASESRRRRDGAPRRLRDDGRESGGGKSEGRPLRPRCPFARFAERPERLSCEGRAPPQEVFRDDKPLGRDSPARSPSLAEAARSSLAKAARAGRSGSSLPASSARPSGPIQRTGTRCCATARTPIATKRRG